MERIVAFSKWDELPIGTNCRFLELGTNCRPTMCNELVSLKIQGNLIPNSSSKYLDNPCRLSDLDRDCMRSMSILASNMPSLVGSLSRSFLFCAITLASPCRLLAFALNGAHIFTQWSKPDVAMYGKVGCGSRTLTCKERKSESNSETMM